MEKTALLYWIYKLALYRPYNNWDIENKGTTNHY